MGTKRVLYSEKKEVMSLIKNKILILDTREGLRRLDADFSIPKGMLGNPETGVSILGLQQRAFQGLDSRDIAYIGGYHVEKILQIYNGISIFYIEPKHRNDLSACLKSVEKDLEGAHYIWITSTDYVFRPSVVEMLSNRPEDVVAIFSNNRGLKECGIIRITKDAYENSKKFINDNKITLFSNFFDLDVFDKKYSSKILWADKDLTYIGSNQDLHKFQFGTKAETLKNLKPILKSAEVLELLTISYQDWYSQEKEILKKIHSKFLRQKIVVRSTAFDEDQPESSLAGFYKSFLNVDSSNNDEVQLAINSVFDSYEKNGGEKETQEVLIQVHLADVQISGVIFSRDNISGGPYCIINYDGSSCATDTVTSGVDAELQTVYCLLDHMHLLPDNLKHVSSLVNEIKDLTGLENLDIEFAITKEEKLILFQVRPLVVKNHNNFHQDSDIVDELLFVSNHIKDYQVKNLGVLGEKTFFSNMTDWNPAEMIGKHPHLLDLSIYKKLICDSTWAESRGYLGYRRLYGVSLIKVFCGYPYVDVRASFNSFIPNTLSNDLAEKLVNTYLKKLQIEPYLHDKVEFDITHNVYTFDFKERAGYLAEYGFSDEEINELSQSCLKITNDLIMRSENLFSEADAASMEIDSYVLDLETKILESSSFQDFCVLLESAISFCSKRGVFVFANMARLGFIGMAFVKSLEKIGALSINDVNVILSSIPTIASEIEEDLKNLSSSNRQDFIKKYGHLRPKTYDIKSLAYRDLVDYFLRIKGANHTHSVGQDCLNENKVCIENLLSEHGFLCDYSALKNFIIKSIQYRESAKFSFTKIVDVILKIIKKISAILEISVDDIRNLDIETFLAYASYAPKSIFEKEIKRKIEYNKKYHSLTEKIKLPDLILDINDVFCFYNTKAKPNFVSNKGEIIAPVYEILDIPAPEEIYGKIAVIENADPGYDWLFSCGIAGLITKYGGVASHMAIRAAEFSLPAAIGCGEDLYNKVKGAKVLSLDCHNHQIKVIQ